MKNHGQAELTVEERVRVELDAHRRDNPGQRLSVQEICRRAGVSRSNLYEAYPSLVEEIRGTSTSVQKAKPRATRQSDPRDSVQHLKERNHALLMLCSELLQELRVLRSRLERVQKSKRK